MKVGHTFYITSPKTMDLQVPNMKNIQMNIGNVGEENLDWLPPDFSLPSPASLSIKPNMLKCQMV